MTQTRILFICHGNICRSPAAEIVFRQLLEQNGLQDRAEAASAAATAEEIGNDIYPPMRRVLLAHGVPCPRRAARQITRQDYGRYDLLIGMDDENLRDMRRVFGGDPDGKLSALMSWAGFPGRSVSDPWYTRDFEKAYRDIELGCRGLLENVTIQPKAE